MCDNLDQMAMQLIVAAGNAKSSYIEAVQEAKAKNFEKAELLLKEGKQAALIGHTVHAELLQKSTEEGFVIPLLLLHAEDQMMSCETISIMAEELIEINKQNRQINERIDAIC